MFKKGIIVVIVLLFSACSGKSKQDMLMSHDWYYDMYISKPPILIDGKEIEDLQSIDCFDKDCFVRFQKATFDMYISDKNCLSKGQKAEANGSYILLDDNTMQVTNNEAGVSIEWEIVELTEDVFHYKAEISGKAFNEIRLVK